MHALNLIAYFDEMLELDIPFSVTQDNKGYIIRRIESRLEHADCKFYLIGRSFVPNDLELAFNKIYLDKKKAHMQGRAILKLHSKDPELDQIYDRVTKALSTGAGGSSRVRCQLEMNGQIFDCKEIERDIFYYDS